MYQVGCALFVYVGFHLPALCSVLDVSNEIVWTWISVGSGDPQVQRCEEKNKITDFFYFFFWGGVVRHLCGKKTKKNLIFFSCQIETVA